MSERRDKAISKVGALRRRKLLHLGKNIGNGLGHQKKYIRRVLYDKSARSSIIVILRPNYTFMTFPSASSQSYYQFVCERIAKYNADSEVEEDRSHLHDLGFFVLEMVIDGFDEAIGEFLHFGFHVAQLIFCQSAGRLKFLRFIHRRAPV